MGQGGSSTGDGASVTAQKQLEAARLAAAQAARRLVGCAESGDALSAEDRSTLEHYESLREQAAQRAGLSADATVVEIQRRASTVDRLSPLLQATAADLPALAGAQAAGRALASGERLDARLQSVLIGLADLIRAGRSEPGPLARLLTEAAGVGDPPDLSLVISLAAAGHLTFVEAKEEPNGDTARQAEVSTNRASESTELEAQPSSVDVEKESVFPRREGEPPPRPVPAAGDEALPSEEGEIPASQVGRPHLDPLPPSVPRTRTPSGATGSQPPKLRTSGRTSDDRAKAPALEAIAGISPALQVPALSGLARRRWRTLPDASSLRRWGRPVSTPSITSPAALTGEGPSAPHADGGESNRVERGAEAPPCSEAEVDVESVGHEEPGEEQAPQAPIDSKSPPPPAAVTPHVAATPAPDVATAAAAAALTVRDARASETVLEEDVLRLVAERRFGLAMHLVRAAGSREPLAAAFGLLAVADTRSVAAGTGSGAERAREAIEELATTEDEVETSARLAAIAACITVARTAPHLGGAQLLQEFASVLSGDEALHVFVLTLAEAAGRGVLIDDQLLGSLGDVAERDAHLQQLADDARAKRDHPPNLVYPRATELLRELIGDPHSELGLVIEAVADDDVTRLAEVRSAAARLGDRSTALSILHSATESDRRRTKRKPIIGRAEAGFLSTAADIARLGGDWVRLRSAADGNTTRDWLAGAGDRLRAASARLLSVAAADEAPSDLVAACRQTVEGVARALAHALSTATLPVERTGDPVWALHGELMRDPAIRLGAELEPLEQLEAAQLLALLPAPDWEQTLRDRAASGDEPDVQRLLAAISGGEVSVTGSLEEMEADAAHRLAEARASVELQRERLGAELAASFQQGALSAEDWQRLERATDEVVDGPGTSTSARAAAYRSIAKRIREAAAMHTANEGERLLGRARHAQLPEEGMLRLQQALNDQDVATVEHTVLALERGEPLTLTDEDDDMLVRVFPELGRQLRERGADASALADELEKTGQVTELPAAPLEGERRVRAAGGLRALRAVHADGGQSAVGTVVGLLGLRVESVKPAERVGGWKAFDVVGVPTERALLPQFGSGASGRYRVLLVPSSDATEELITSTLRATAGGPPCILLHSKALTDGLLRGVAERARRLAPDVRALLCDLSLCLAVSVLGPGSLNLTERLALPFTALNPYDPYLSGQVPEEMFYGRTAALQDLASGPEGNIAFVFGGRRLGKSALLRAAEREARRRERVEAVFIDLKDEGVGFPDPPARVAELLLERFAHLLPDVSSKQQPMQRFGERARALYAQGGPRLLVLLDEADEMIDADYREGFRVLDGLRRLQEDTEKHVRFVFAGLHSVKRFSDTSNLRLIQFGRSVAIGALEAERARDLLRRPAKALGYRLEDRSVNRILTLTQYQPSLIQLVMDKLLRHLHGRTRTIQGPPYHVTLEDVEGVLKEPRLQEEIAERFELTTVLDSRYRLIALVCAYLASGRAATELFEIRELREQCDFWWPAGFADTSETEFTTLLLEMEGLGLLFGSERRYGLYSPHVARLLGTEAQIIDRLAEAGRQSPSRRGFDPIALRMPLPPVRRGQSGALGPLNMRQVARLQEPDDGLLSILVTPALGSALLPRALAQGLPDGDFEVLEGPEGDLGWLINKIKRSTRRRHRIAWIRAAGADVEELSSGMREIARSLSGRGRERATAKALIVIDLESLGAWRQLNERGLTTGLDLTTMRVRRHNPDSLASWTRVAGVDLPQLESQDSVEQLLEATGGWPELVDDVVAQLRRTHELGPALEACRAKLADDPTGFVQRTGVEEDAHARSLLATALDLAVDGVPAAEAAVLLGELSDMELPLAASALDVLVELGALETSPEGLMRPEPVLGAAFSLAVR